MNKTEEIDFEAIVIGAGFSGLYQLHALRDKLGMSVHLFEAADDLGGTWYWNRYPGARCDSESHTYCYYFSEELLQEWEWSERYPEQKEILEYLNFAADRLDLRTDITFSNRITQMVFDEESLIWTVISEAGREYKTRFIINAVGCLSSTNIPNILGKERFKGSIYHTGEWPHVGVNFSGKSVAVIGTGSSGIQTIPEVGKLASQTTVFQRTPNYSIPARNEKLSQTFIEEFKSSTSEWMRKMLLSRGGHAWPIPTRHLIDTPVLERRKILEEAWSVGGLGFRECFDDILVNISSNSIMSDFIKDKIKDVVKDPDKSAILTNIDYPFSTKRPPIDTEYFEAFNEKNVNIVDIKTDPITEITAKGIKTQFKEFFFDIIIFATGFDAMTGSMLKIDVIGRKKKKLKDVWKAGPLTYLGLQVEGFPNMFILTGPGSPSVLTNMPRTIEHHVEFVTGCISHMVANNFRAMEPSNKAMVEWVEHVNEVANKTLLPKTKHSWYLGSNVPGKPQVFMPYAGGLNNYRDICSEIVEDGYRGFNFTLSLCEVL